jgi:hypothetical protein
VTTAVVEKWIEKPLRQFVEDAQVMLALILTPSGQVLGQHGFSRAVDVMSACALAAAIHASGGELGRQLQGRPFGGLHHPGAVRQLFLASAETPRGVLLCMTVFDEATSFGLVQLYFDELRARLAAAAPASDTRAPTVLAETFEEDLDRNLALLFRR